MKKAKKLFAMLLALVLVLGLAAPAMAAVDPNQSATVRVKGSEVATFAARDGGGTSSIAFNGYRLMTLTSVIKPETDSVHNKHEKNQHTLECYNFSYTPVDTYVNDMINATNGIDVDGWSETVNADNLVEFLGKLNSDQAQDFANAFWRAIKADDPIPDVQISSLKPGNVEQGYWLFVDVHTSSGDVTGDVYSPVLLATQGQTSLTITPKGKVPTVEKKVQEKNDSTGTTSGWQDGADYDIGDDVPFQLTGTLPSNIGDYETYEYVFHDTLSAGLSFNDDVAVKIVGNDGDEKTLTVGTDYKVEQDNTADECNLEIVFDDILKSLKDVTVTANTKVVVTYTAKLTGDAVVSGNSGNPNKVYLEYSNNPYGDGTGKTPEDKVTVFTFTLNVDKVDGDGKPLAGAGFTLYKKTSSSTDAWSIVGDGEVKVDAIPEGGKATFTWKGLDSGTYKLVESTTPAGYNKAEDIEFVVEATYTTEGDEQKVTGLVIKDSNGNVVSSTPENPNATFNVTVDSGKIETTVVNTTGPQLPSTGGIGTTIFYILGGVLVVGAGIVFVTKRRMDVSDR